MCRCPLQFFKRSNDGTPTPVSRSMPAVLAAQRDRRLAGERAETAVNHAEEDREHRGVREVIPLAGSNPSRPIPSGDNATTYFQVSFGFATILLELQRFSMLAWFLENLQHPRITVGT